MKFETHRFRLRRSPSSETLQPQTSESISTVLETNNESRREQYNITIPPPACNRCRQHKKKCSKTLPSCKSCVDAGRKCSYFDSRQSLLAPAHVLQARIQWLTQYIEDNVHSNVPEISSPIQQRGSLTSAATTPQDADGMSISGKETSVGLGSFQVPDLPTPVSGREHGAVEYDPIPTTSPTDVYQVMTSTENCRDTRAISVSSRVPEGILPLSSACIDAYFHHVHRAYPFVDKERITQTKRSNLDITLFKDDADSMMLFLVHAIGCTSLERSGKISLEVARTLQVPYSDILQYCIANTSTDSVQVLVLLALYSLFDPRGVQTWTIVGIITRQAMLLGLTRRDTAVDTVSTSSVEVIHRLFWSIYVLDRMVAVSVGQPPGLTGRNIDIPLPAVTVNEFASPQRSDISGMLQVSHHVIELRRLEAKILESVHLCDRTRVSSMSSSDRTAITDNMQYEIDNWYSAGCLISRPEAGNVRIHDTMAWFNARYYQLLMTLHYPCHFNRRGRPISYEKLLSFVEKYIHYDHVLLEQRQLPLNYITLSRMVPVSLVLIHCFACSVETVFPAKGTIQNCIAILREFSNDWHQAQSLAQVMADFSVLVSTYENRSANGLIISQTLPMIRPTSQSSMKTWLESIRKRVIDIGGHIMGKSNCYQYVDDWDEVVAEVTAPSSHYPTTEQLAAEPPSIAGLINGQIEFGFL